MRTLYKKNAMKKNMMDGIDKIRSAQQVLGILTLLFMTCFSFGCATQYGGGSGEVLYKKSQNGPRVLVPPPLTDAMLSHLYELPDVSGPTDVSILPPTDI